MTPNAVKKLRVYPSEELHQVWKSWLAGYRWIYNWTIASLIKRKRFKMRQAAQRLKSKTQKLVKDLHNKASLFLVNNYKVIFLPTFETSQMV